MMDAYPVDRRGIGDIQNNGASFIDDIANES
jgi:hypothetical protein